LGHPDASEQQGQEGDEPEEGLEAVQAALELRPAFEVILDADGRAFAEALLERGRDGGEGVRVDVAEAEEYLLAQARGETGGFGFREGLGRKEDARADVHETGDAVGFVICGGRHGEFAPADTDGVADGDAQLIEQLRFDDDRAAGEKFRYGGVGTQIERAVKGIIAADDLQFGEHALTALWSRDDTGLLARVEDLRGGVLFAERGFEDGVEVFGERLIRAESDVATEQFLRAFLKTLSETLRKAGDGHYSGHADAEATGEIEQAAAGAANLAKHHTQVIGVRHGGEIRRSVRGRGFASGLDAVDPTVAQINGAVCEFGDGGVVRDEHQGDALALLQLDKQVEHRAPSLAVEVAGGFVGEQETGIGSESAREGYALLLAARKLGGVMVAAFGKADLGEERVGGIAAVRGAAKFERHEHVFARGHMREQVERLEHEADFLAAQPREPVF
jgi:hypothetical protein